ncbi:MAG: VF530 family protein [Planctomycetota bacterium]|jgi:uncharacterized protein (DUF2132 family)|nr:VF530 family protein [Planctomycetota bacterium]
MSDANPHDANSKDPLHGMTLERILVSLVERYGWESLGASIDIRCFQYDPSIKSSLKFLRRTPWARKKVENLYLRSKRNLWGQEDS